MLKFLQRIGKSLMLPIAALPVAAIMLRLGQQDVIDVINFIPFVESIFPFLGAAGAAIFDNLTILFALGVAVGLSDDQNGAAALAGIITFFVITNVTEQYWVTNMPDIADTLDTSFLGAILSGIIAGLSYNKFRNVKLPDYLAFFGGRRFVPIMSSFIAFAVAIPLAIIWPSIQGALDSASISIAGMGAIGVAIFGFFNRLLIPLGLHHVLNSFFWFQLGEFNGATGDLSRFFAGDPTAGHFMAGFFPVMMFGLPAVALAIYFAAKKEHKKAVGGMLISLAFTSFLTGITEPIEFLFIFLSPILLVAHALLTGLSLFITDTLGVLHGFGFSAGAIDYLLNYNLATNAILIIPIGLGIGALYFFVFYTLITKMNLPTPGREDDFTAHNSENTKSTHHVATTDTTTAKAYIEALGGSNNIVTVDNCATRLRLDVNDSSVVNDKHLKELGAKGVLKLSSTSVQVIVGTQVEFLANDIKSLL